MTRDLPPILEVPALDGVAAGAEVPVIKSLTALRREIADAWMKMQDGEVAQHYASIKGLCVVGAFTKPLHHEPLGLAMGLAAV